MTWLLVIWLTGGYKIGSVTLGPEYSTYEKCDESASTLKNAGLNAICIKKESFKVNL